MDLQAIAPNRRETFSQGHIDQNPTADRLVIEEFQDLRNKLLYPVFSGYRRRSPEKSAQPFYNFTGVAPIPHDSLHRLADSIKVGFLPVEPLKARFRIGDHGRKWLVDLMSYSGGKLAKSGELARSRERAASVLRKAASAVFLSSMSILTPNHLDTEPVESNNGAPRKRNQRYWPS